VLAHKTVFIDDNADNVWAARGLGMAVIEHRSTPATLASLAGYFPALRRALTPPVGHGTIAP
jgi:FMN phosphatase YigB (HAD superfamily)